MKRSVVETRINVRDIGHVRLGQPVSVKVSSYDFARYGTIAGRLTGISATTFLDPDQNPYYRGKVTLARNYVGADPARNVVLPGMTVQADINTGEKTLMQYLLKPIYTSIHDSFRER